MTLEGEFERVWPWLEKAIDPNRPTHSKEHVWADIEAGGAQLWTSQNAALVTRIMVWPTGFREAIAWLAGGSLKEIQAMTPGVVHWAETQMGVDQCSILLGRIGWGRALPGFKLVGAQFVKDR